MAALAVVAKKVASFLMTEMILDPEKLLKIFLFGIGLPLLIIALFFAIPTQLITSIPTLLFSGFSEGNVTEAELDKQFERIAVYQRMPISLGVSSQEWVDTKKEQYAWCDEIRVDYSFLMDWQMIMAIDAVRYNQDFSHVSAQEVLSFSSAFVLKSATTEQYQFEESYEVEREITNPETGIVTTKTVTKTRLVTKTRAIISVSTKAFEEMLASLSFDQPQTEIATNIYQTLLTTDMEGNFNVYDEVDLKDLILYPPGSASIIYFNQADIRWGAKAYGNSTIKSGGCGPTALAMVMSSLLSDPDLTPDVVAAWSVANGHRAEGAGSYWSLMTDGPEYYGLTVKQVSRRNPEYIVEALSKGHPVIVAMGRGHFTKVGHFIVLTGLTEDGKVLVNDPASVLRTEKQWSLATIMNESSTNGGTNGSPFWIIKN